MSKDIEPADTLSQAKLLDQLEHLMESAWRTMLTTFLNDAINECQVASTQNSSEEAQAAFLYTLNWLKKNRQMVETDAPKQLSGKLINELINLSASSSPPSTEERSREEQPKESRSKEELDKHLKLKNIINQAHRHLESRIALVNQFFSLLFDTTIDGLLSPIGPSALIDGFFQLITSTTMPEPARPTIYSAFDRALNKHLKEFYRQLISLFLDAGFIIGSPSPIKHTTKKGHEEKPDKDQLPGKNRKQKTVFFTKNQLDGAVAELIQHDSQYASSTPLPDLVTRQLVALYPDNASHTLTDIHTHLIAMVDQLFRAIDEETNLTPHARGWILQLRFSFLQIILDDPTFIDDNSNLARSVLNQLIQLGMIKPTLNHRLETGLNSMITAVQCEGGRRYEALVKMNKVLDKILAHLDKTFEATAKKVADKNESENADKIAHDAINQLIAGKAVPSTILELVQQCWFKNLRFLAHTEGKSSSHFADNVQALEMLNDWLCIRLRDEELPTTKKSIVDLLAYMDQALTISFGHNDHRRILKHIHGIFFNDQSDQLITIPSPWNGVIHHIDPDQATEEVENSPQSRETEERIQQRAQEILPGDWVHANFADLEEQNLQMVWSNDFLFSFIYADSEAIKPFNIKADVLAEELASGNIRVIEDIRSPFVDRVMSGILASSDTDEVSLAARDSLTGLLNRYEFEKRLHSALTSAQKNETEQVMCYLDIDQFKLINNTLGTDVGDKVLQKTAQILETIVPENASLARLGGNEFGLLLKDCDSEVGHAFAERARRTIQQTSYKEIAQHATITLSIGLILIDSNSTSVSAMLQHSSDACEQAKQRGRNRVRSFIESDSDRRLRNRVLNWISKIDKSLDQDWLYLKGQMIKPIRRGNKKLPHYEVLLGVTDDEGEMVSPVHFIEAAEKYNRMPKVDRWVVNTALKWMREHPKVLEKIDGLSINLSGQSFNDENFLEHLSIQMANTSVPQEKICFEVTETAAIENLDYATEFVHKIRETGCRFSLDDFGTGMSSYAYLKQLPVDYLKIDGVFIRDIATNKTNYGLVKSVNEIAHLMGKQTIAEFVENDEILEILNEIGVDHAQGWGIEKPRPLESIT